MASFPDVPAWVRDTLREGVVIPAHPLALTRERRLDEERQRGLTRYYCQAGAGGIAIGVHTTQFEIRRPEHRLLEPVLKLARETLDECELKLPRPMVRVTGICGTTTQAVEEARLGRELGFHAGLLSLAALRSASDVELISHCRTVASEIPVFGFYLQPAVGGRVLSYEFWRQFVEIPNVVAIKVAAFNRYHTIEVLRALAESGRAGEIALYTGNDDNIVIDLLTRHEFITTSGPVRLGFAGGLLGHWAFWTRGAVRLLDRCKAARAGDGVPAELLTLASQVTDCNAAVFDVANGFAGCIPGIHEMLRRQGLLENVLCLNPNETLSPGQRNEIDRIYRAYPHLSDPVEERLA
ncbi:MAG: dihydrodipicolinate synthase family protein [Verrucomicrobiota bacterium]